MSRAIGAWIFKFVDENRFRRELFELPNQPKADSPLSKFHGMPERMTEYLEKESDRGKILILTAYIEEILGLIIYKSCVNDNVANEILKLRQPAGDLDSRILICEAFGKIHEQEVRALRLLQRIRNKAAHFDRKGNGFDVLFDSPATCDQVAAMCKIFNLELSSRSPHAVSEYFALTVRLLATRLYMRLIECRQAPPILSSRDLANQARNRLKGTPIGELIAEAEEQANNGDLEQLFAINKALRDALSELLDQTTSPGPSD